jgi:ABC-type lipoprotein export system ATPase subunit
MIRAEDLCLDLPLETGKSRQVLNSLSFHLPRGSVSIINGPSGSGKSSLLAVLATWKRPSSGSLFLDNRPVSKYTAAFRDSFRKNIGFAPQHPLLFHDASILDNILLPTIPLYVSRSGCATRAHWLMDKLDLSPMAHRKARNLSGGEQQRVAIARALINRPAILLLDEPSSHQDDLRTTQILDLVEQAQQEGSTIVIASHDNRLAKFPQSIRTFALNDGKLAEKMT